MNNTFSIKITEEQYHIIKTLLRLELAIIMEENASNKVIDDYMALDVSLTEQYSKKDIEDGLPF
jgi:hypothetical protein